MSARGHAAIQRATDGRDCHLAALLQSLEELKSHSSPERLPHVVEGLGDACSQLQNVLSSTQFRVLVGDAFPRLPPLANMGRASRPALPESHALEDEAPMGDYSDPEEDQATSACAPIRGSRNGAQSSARARSPQPAADAGSAALSLPLPSRARQDSPEGAFQSCLFFAQKSSRRSGSVPAAIRATWRALYGFKEAALPAAAVPALPAADPAPAGAPADLVTNLPSDGWISHTGPGGRTSWHHKSLGPAPWEESLTKDSAPDTNPFSKDLSKEPLDAPAQSRNMPENPGWLSWQIWF